MSVIRVRRIAYVAFRAPDLGLAERFLRDFGMRASEYRGNVMYTAGYGDTPFLHRVRLGEPGFEALGLGAASVEDLHRLSEATGAPVSPSDAPGGGWLVELTDPNGLRVEVVAGEAATDPAAARGQAWNSRAHRTRLSATKRLAAGPAHIHRLGHCVLAVRDFRESERWYKSLFGFITSDEIHVTPGKAMGAFMRCDLDDEPTDHHAIFLAERPEAPVYNHAAFEVDDVDDLMAGHDHLAGCGYRSVWGVGRHVLGSQVFDYWLDPWGHQVELWTDGDLLTRADGSNIAPVHELRRVQWGMPFPEGPPPRRNGQGKTHS